MVFAAPQSRFNTSPRPEGQPNPFGTASSSGVGSNEGPMVQRPAPANVSASLPEPSVIESRKLACHQSLEEQMKTGEDILSMQQKSQAEYIYQAAEAQKQQLANQIDQQAKQQEILLNQKYEETRMKLQQELIKQKLTVDYQANDLAKEFQSQRSQESLPQGFASQLAEPERSQAVDILKAQPTQWIYNPDIRAPVDIRQEPDIEAPRTKEAFEPGEHFLVSEERRGANGVLYLKLADGRGWLFDGKPGAGTMCIRLADQLRPASKPQLAPQTSVEASGMAAAPAIPAVSSTCSVSSAATVRQWRFCPERPAPLDIRRGPDMNGPRTNFVLQSGEVFNVAEELRGSGGVLYLRLADGRGWVFDHKPGVGQLCAPEPVLAAPQQPTVTWWRYDPEVVAPVDLRAAPHIDAPRTQSALNPGDVFAVSEECLGADGTLYLRLSDGRGWVFERKPGVGVMCRRNSPSFQPVSSTAQYAAQAMPRTVQPGFYSGAAASNPTLPPTQPLGSNTGMPYLAPCAQPVQANAGRPTAWPAQAPHPVTQPTSALPVPRQNAYQVAQSPPASGGLM